MSAVSLGHRADLQGLRGIAIVLVVLAHAGVPGLAGGFVGVDVFFVLSGYLISGLLLREHHATGRIRLAAFVARRLRRLLPALLVMLVSVACLAAILLSAHEFSVQTASAAYAATWTSNLYFAFTEFDYFNELHLRDLFLHTWSLGVEEQFYLAWPVVLLALFAMQGNRPGPTYDRGPLLPGLAVLFLASFGLSQYWTANAATWAFYLMPSRIWQFALGAMIFCWTDPPGRPATVRMGRLHAWSGPLGFAGLGLIVGSALLFDPRMAYPGVAATLPSLGAALVIAAGAAPRGAAVARLLAHPAAVWVGDRSYSLYLWHWPLLMLGFAWGLERLPVSVAALIALSMIFASASYRWVELPIWKGRPGEAPPGVVIAASIAVIATATVSITGLSAGLRDDAGSGVVLARSARSDLPEPYAVSGCDTWFMDATLQPCVFGRPDAERTAVLLGDSIATQWFSLLPGILDADDWRIIVLTKSSCAIVDESYHYGPVGEYRVCSEWRGQAVDFVTRVAPDIAFVGSAATYAFSAQQWKQGTGRILDRLSPAVGQVILIPGTPQLSFDGPGCLERWWAQDPAQRSEPPLACREPRKRQVADTVVDYLAEVADGYDNVDMLDLNGLVCPDGSCGALDANGVVVFRDRQHLTDSFVRSQVDTVRQRLIGLGLGAPAGGPG